MSKDKSWSRKRNIVIIILFSLLLTGCWNRRELKELGIVGMIGIEKAESGVRVTVEILKPERKGGTKAGGKSTTGGTEAKTPVVYVQAEGETIFDAFRNATLQSDRRFFHAHTRLFVFSEEIARQGLASQLDVVYRDHEFRTHVPIVIAIDAAPAEIMGLAAGVEGVPSKYLHSVVTGGRNSAKAVFVRVLDFMQLYKGQGKNAVLGIIRRTPKNKITPQDSDYEINEEGSAVFKKDKLVGLLDGEETRGYNWALGNVKTAAFVGQSTGIGQRTTVEIFSADSNLDVLLDNGKMKLILHVNVPATIMEETGTVNVNDLAVVAMLEASTAEAIKGEIQRTFLKAREFRTDVFGFGIVVRRKYPKEWKQFKNDWDEIFAEAESEVEVKVNIMRIGKAVKPVKE